MRIHPFSAAVVAFIAFIAVSAFQAQASTITFDTVPAETALPSTFTEDNLTLTLPASNNYFASAGSGGLRGNPGNGGLLFGAPATGAFAPVLTYAGGAVFDFLSIDVNEENSAGGSQSFLFVGTKSGGGTVSEAFNTDANYNNYETFVPALDFTGLTSLRIDTDFAVIDNVTAVVPEPSTAALFAVGILGLVSWRRR